MDRQEVMELLKRYLDGSATEAERVLVETWYAKSNREIPTNLEAAFLEKQLQEIWGAVQPRPARRLQIYRYAAAAVLLLGLSWLVKLGIEKQTSTSGTQVVALAANTISPGRNTAQLHIDGEGVVELDTTQTGIVVSDAGLNYTDGEKLTYSVADAKKKPTEYQLVTPKGGQYQVRLSDGTRVWLNAATSLSYPASFVDGSRVVKLDGEAYFEVAKDTHRPFKVITHRQVIEVLGTHFNVNSYSDEPIVRTTLAGGSVRVTSQSGEAVLVPGEQSQVNSNGELRVEPVSLDEVLAWKRGVFQFEGTDIDIITRQFARWYDVDIIFEGERPSLKLWGKVSRAADAGQALAVLEFFGLKYRVEGSETEGKRVTVYK